MLCSLLPNSLSAFQSWCLLRKSNKVFYPSNFYKLFLFRLNDSLSDTHPVLSRFTPPNLAIQELISPLSKRFYYHFSGNRPTNRKDKPEWYLCQILQWIGDHVKFIETEIQPIYKPKDAFLEFSRGLVQLVVEKLIRDSMAYLEDDRLLAHAIGQVLEFETKLRTLYDYPSHQPSALLVLAQPQFFTRWLSLEKASKFLLVLSF